MKQLINILALLFIANIAIAQAPQAIPYQAVARNSSGTILASTNIGVRFTIRDSIATGAIRYRETHSVTTTPQGLFTANVGGGTPVTGTFSNINWATNAKFLQVEIDPTGGSSYIDMGTQQMMSVPYALFANQVISSHASPIKKAKITYQVPSGTGAGAAVAGAWTTRPLNTVVYDDIGINLASDQISLPIGTYEISAYCVFNNANFKVGDEKIRIRNTTNNTTIGISLNSSMSVAANYSSFPAMIHDERFTLTTMSNIALQYYIYTPHFGVPWSPPRTSRIVC